MRMSEAKKKAFLEMLELYRLLRVGDDSRDSMHASIDLVSKYMSANPNALGYEYGKIMMRYLIDRDEDKALTNMVITSYEAI